MRVTENTSFDRVRDSIRKSKGKMEELQTQSSTFKKMNTPSDNPVGAAKVLEIRTDKVNTEQYQANAKLAEAYLNNTDHALSEIGEILIRAKEIAIGQSSPASANRETRLGVAEEVNQLFQTAAAAANRKVGDRYLFGGYKTDKPPINAEGKYVGDPGEILVEVGKDVFISSNITGVEAFNTKPSAIKKSSPETHAPDRTLASEKESEPTSGENINVFNELDTLRIGLLTNDVETIRSTLDRVDKLIDHTNAVRARVGSRVNGIQSSIGSLERTAITQAQLGSNLEDADMAQVVSDLAREETIFRSSLQSSKRLIQPTLLEFLG